MDSLDRYRQIVESVLDEYTKIPYAYGDIRCCAVFDRNRDRYLLITIGWDAGTRVHWVLVHVDIIDGKIWIQRDGTEDGVANEFVQAAIPKEHIVLAFHPPERRKHTEFAVV